LIIIIFFIDVNPQNSLLCLVLMGQFFVILNHSNKYTDWKWKCLQCHAQRHYRIISNGFNISIIKILFYWVSLSSFNNWKCIHN